MHEANFTRQIVDAVLGDLKKHPKKHAKQVQVQVGEMLHLVPDSVQLHFDLLTRGTVLEGVDLLFQEKPVTIRCNHCQKIGGVEDHHLLMCTFCDSRDVDLLSGNEIEIASVTA